ncbi:MAG: PaaI family thioesterase [Nocardioidaceae bacterium]|nr:PaaI family thioesterase [Nocardioidaceae bacterium]
MTEQAVSRSRSTTWEDPAITAAQLGRTSGLEMLEAVRDGRLPAPPIAATLGFGLDVVEDGRAVFSLEPAEHHYNPIGSVHGGVFATLLDSAAGCAVHSTLPAGSGYTSVDLNVKFVRGITAATGRVVAEGVVVNRGRRLVLAEARLVDGDGRLLATATSSCLVFEV